MFEKLAEPLPSYSRFVQQAKQIILSSDRAGHERLLNILALIYSDILGVCQRAVRIFATKGNGIRHKLNVINDIFWKPFDKWFSDVLDRLSRHQSLFEFELILTSKTDARDHYTKVDKELEDARNFREMQVARSQREDTRVEKEEAVRFQQQIRDIKDWIHAPDYTALPQRESAEATEGTCQWFIGHPKYAAWKKMNNPARSTAQGQDKFPILWVQGPPGYGKTILSNFVVEDLRSTSHQVETDAGDIVYFYFDKLSQDCKEPQHAMRAILNQIVHVRRDLEDIVDAVTMLMDVEGSGQRIASESDLATALSFTLRYFPNLILLLDGVDECSEPDILLRTLFSIFGNNAVRIILFSRPEIAVPSAWKASATVLRLGSQENIQCIQRFVRPRIEQMKQSQMLPPGVSTDELTSMISARANSLFLWAKLMMVYLECPALSPRARLQTISERNLVEGLDKMYSRILDLISKKLRPQKEVAFKTFQWLVAAHRPLHSLELQAALAVPIGRATDPDDYITNFDQSLATICGSLINVQGDGGVQFIHLSVKEFLTGDHFRQYTASPGIFHIDVSVAQFWITSSCLSYLQYDVPAHPLSGSTKITSDRTQIRDKLPLLGYAVDWWKNAVAGFLNLHSNSLVSFQVICSTFLPLLQRFLRTKPTVTVWVESIWTLSITPPLQLLSDEMSTWGTRLSTLFGEQSSEAVEQLRKAGRDIADLSLDLQQLQDEWGTLLSANPTELWEPSINAFHSSRFLVRTDVSNIAWSTAFGLRASPDDTLADENNSMRGMILLSQVSEDGSCLSSISLIPPV
jgi:Cdc6-like AAA superfamily ATPase